MALTDTQVRQLRAKLDARHVKSRKANGTDLHYVEGWHVIAEANRIFGYDAWDRRTLASHCVWSGTSGAYHGAAYTAKVRVSVRAGDITIVREGSGTGEGKAPTPGQAHEFALKGAEIDATKRALATFGNPFGLALYDREQVGVRKARGETTSPAIGPWVLRSATGADEASFDTPSAFASALRKAMTEAHDIELLFAIWEQNVETVRALNRSLKQDHLPNSGIAPQLVGHLKQCAIALVKPQTRDHDQEIPPALNGCVRPKIDKSVLTISEPKRHRSKEHLRFVAQQPCLICGRSPSHPHHIRYAQPRGLGLKVSDEFTVPLCASHHSENHTRGDESRWWQEHKLDPLPVARRLWQKSRSADFRPDAATTIESDEKKPISG
jgi:Rad52/22 family double-strand break repair protein